LARFFIRNNTLSLNFLLAARKLLALSGQFLVAGGIKSILKKYRLIKFMTSLPSFKLETEGTLATFLLAPGFHTFCIALATLWEL